MFLLASQVCSWARWAGLCRMGRFNPEPRSLSRSVVMKQNQVKPGTQTSESGWGPVVVTGVSLWVTGESAVTKRVPGEARNSVCDIWFYFLVWTCAACGQGWWWAEVFAAFAWEAKQIQAPSHCNNIYSDSSRHLPMLHPSLSIITLFSAPVAFWSPDCLWKTVIVCCLLEPVQIPPQSLLYGTAPALYPTSYPGIQQHLWTLGSFFRVAGAQGMGSSSAWGKDLVSVERGEAGWGWRPLCCPGPSSICHFVQVSCIAGFLLQNIKDTSSF